MKHFRICDVCDSALKILAQDCTTCVSMIECRCTAILESWWVMDARMEHVNGELVCFPITTRDI